VERLFHKPCKIFLMTATLNGALPTKDENGMCAAWHKRKQQRNDTAECVALDSN